MIVAVVVLVWGIALIIGGSVGVSRSQQVAVDSVSKQLVAAGIVLHEDIPVLLEASPTRSVVEDVNPVYRALSAMPEVESVSPPIPSMMSPDKSAAVIAAALKAGTDTESARTAIADRLAHLDGLPATLEVTVLGATAPSSPSNTPWIALGIGALMVFASGAIGFAHPWHRGTASPQPQPAAGWTGTTPAPVPATGSPQHPAGRRALTADESRDRALMLISAVLTLLSLAGLICLFSIFDVPPSNLTRVPSLGLLTMTMAFIGGAIRITRDSRRS
ncbi:hypothetical protein [Nocardia sp. NPDC057668]|uniref:hypothetical protein n=1 Tax=Nocardia sp. NPDC057668 TaxID=3346202 RepID=UPI003672DBF2